MEKVIDIERYVTECSAKAISLLETLGKIPAPSYHEEKRAHFCKEWLINEGAGEVWIDDAKNVVFPVDCDSNEEIVVFMAHMDVVFDDLDELTMKRDGNVLHAPGIGDDTANLVNLMMAIKYVITRGIEFNKGVLFVFNACEEGLGNLNGCKTIFREFGSKITEFYSLDGYLSHCIHIPVGSHRYKITAKEEGGHSYEDFGNGNAIYTLSLLIQELYRIDVPKDEKTTFNVGHIQGGTTVNSIAEKAEMLYEFRSPCQNCLSVMEQEFKRVISEFKGKGHNISVQKLGVRPGKGRMDEKALEDWTNRNIDIIKKYYSGSINRAPASTDANIPLSKGILANTIGTIKGGRAHTRNEWVDLESLPQGIRIVLELIVQYAKTMQTDN